MKWAGTVVGLVAAVAVAAGCGGDGTGTDGATPAATDYASCLRANGVAIPSAGPDARPSGRPTTFPSTRPSGRPSGGPGEPGGFGGPGGPGGPGGFGFGSQAPAGVDQATWEKAQQACAGLRPSGGPSSRDNGTLTAYRNCLSDHGVTVTGRIDDLDASDPKVAAALQTCAPLRPSNIPPAPSASG